jgi:uncharacterized protein YbdZ (MbtH family)
MEPDRWGVPSWMFGSVDEDFYGLVGRITMVATLLEDRLHVLFGALAGTEQDYLAGKPGTMLIAECCNRLQRFPVQRRAEAAEFLGSARQALLQRHEVVHSLWPFTARDEVHGWRYVPTKNRRRSPEQPVEWTGLHAGQLPDLLRRLLELVTLCYQVERWASLPEPGETCGC